MNAVPTYICAGIYLSDWRTACLIDYEYRGQSPLLAADEDPATNYNIGLVITAMDADEVDYYGIEGDVDFKGATWNWIDVEDDDTVPIGVYFKSVCKDIDAMRHQGKAVLVHCMAGVSRSPTLVAAYLMHSRRWTAAQALAYLIERRPCIYPNAGFRRQLLAWEAELGIE